MPCRFIQVLTQVALMTKTTPTLKNNQRIQKNLPFWLIFPTIVTLLIVQVYPAIYTIWLSLQERSPEGWIYVGTKNFERLFSMGIFDESLGHTIVYLVGYVGLTLIIGFFTAFLLSQKIKFSGLYITLLFIPWVIAQIIVGLVFRLLIVPNYGLLTGFFSNPTIFPPDGLSVLTAVRPTPWFGEFPFPPAPAMIFLIIAATWRALPFVTILLLAAIQTVPTEVLESSRIDGANSLQRIRYIMLPLIMPTLVVAIFNLILSGINGVGMVFSLTGGGPGTNTQILSYLLYTIGWGQLKFGRAAALALFMAAINWLLISGTLRITKTGEQHV